MSKSNARKTVFALDDDPGTLRGLQRLLHAYGYDSQVFGSTAEFNARANLADAVCLVLDINLDGASGIEFRQEIAARHALPVIFITSDDSQTVRQKALNAGCIAYLMKPFSAESLVAAIEAASV